MKKTLLATAIFIAASTSAFAFSLPVPFSGGRCADATGVNQLPAAACAKYFADTANIVPVTAQEAALSQPLPAWMIRWTEIQGRFGE